MRPRANLSIYVFNVGQGDNVLIELPDGSYGLIDFFYDSKIYSQQEPPSLYYLRQKDNVKIKFIHLSHYHRDHVKGIPKLINWLTKNNIVVDYLWFPGSLSPKEMKRRISSAIEDAKVVKKILMADKDLTSYFNKINKNGSDLYSKLENYAERQHENGLSKLDYLNCIRELHECCLLPVKINTYCLAPTSRRAIQFTEKSTEDILKICFGSREKDNVDGNDISSILLMTAKCTKLLFGGDAKIDSIRESLQYIQDDLEKLWGLKDLASDFIKIFHHGSQKSSNEIIWKNFLSKEKDTYIAISAGEYNVYMHPNKETFDHIFTVLDSPYIYSTNHGYLSNRGETRHLIPDDFVDLGWDHYKASALDERKKRFRRVNDLPGLVAEINQERSQIDCHIQFWGYRFDIDLDSNETKVSRLVN